MALKFDPLKLGGLVDAIQRARDDRLAEPGPEPPVVARLMVEIRSDGSRTIARGALEDNMSGEKVAVEARGTTPAALAASLVRSMFSAPLLARAIARRLIK
jgi:hypothetical protein